MSKRFMPILLFAALVVAFGFSLGLDPREMPSTLIDKKAPDFKLPAVIAGQKGLTSGDLNGRLVLLNVYASWCPGCRTEHPTLMRLAKAGTIPLYGINWKDQPGKGALYLKRYENPYVAVGEDANGRVGIDLGVTGVPETFVIDAGGRIRYRHAGPITDDVWEKVFAPLLADLGAKG